MAPSYHEAQEALRAARRRSGRLTYFLDKEAALDAYGGKCHQCGNKDRTVLMVVREFGVKWGVSLTGKPIKSGAAKFRWLRANQWPKGFVLACPECRPTRPIGTPSRPESQS